MSRKSAAIWPVKWLLEGRFVLREVLIRRGLFLGSEWNLCRSVEPIHIIFFGLPESKLRFNIHAHDGTRKVSGKFEPEEWISFQRDRAC